MMSPLLSASTEELTMALNNATVAFTKFAAVFPKLGWRRSRWRMQAKNGRNSKERRRDQVRLKGRRCRRKY